MNTHSPITEESLLTQAMKQLGKYQAVSSKKAIISLLNTYIAWTKIPKYSPNTEQLPALVHILQIKKKMQYMQFKKQQSALL